MHIQFIYDSPNLTEIILNRRVRLNPFWMFLVKEINLKKKNAKRNSFEKKNLFSFVLFFSLACPSIILAYQLYTLLNYTLNDQGVQVIVWHAVKLSERHIIEIIYLNAKINKGHLSLNYHEISSLSGNPCMVLNGFLRFASVIILPYNILLFLFEKPTRLSCTLINHKIWACMYRVWT